MLTVSLEGESLGAGRFRMRCGMCGMDRVCQHQRETHYCGGTKPIAAAATSQAKSFVDGPGTELKALLRDWLGIEASPTCSCNAMARKMNERGPEWCESEEGMAEILGVMRAEHGKRWADGRTKLPWSDLGAKQLVRLACRRARAKASA